MRPDGIHNEVRMQLELALAVDIGVHLQTVEGDRMLVSFSLFFVVLTCGCTAHVPIVTPFSELLFICAYLFVFLLVVLWAFGKVRPCSVDELLGVMILTPYHNFAPVPFSRVRLSLADNSYLWRMTPSNGCALSLPCRSAMVLSAAPTCPMSTFCSASTARMT